MRHWKTVMPEPLKNLFNEQSVDVLAQAVGNVYPPFDRAALMASVFNPDWESLELKARMRHVTTCLRALLPSSYGEALGILRDAARAPVSFGFLAMVFPDFVEVYGLREWDASLPALEQFTQIGSAEFAVRPFIAQNPDRMMAQMLAWAHHENVHVRRLASEGCRPRLPWGMALPVFKLDPAPILPILDRLKLDEEEYVRRSVANNLNDISKDNPQVVIDVLSRWKAHDTPEMQRIITQGLRTLVKKGDPDALALLGYAHTGQYEVRDLFVEPDEVPAGGEMTFSFAVHSSSEETQNLVIDYIVHLMRANGQPTPKVFKLTKLALPPGGALNVVKRHSFRPVTTRRYYPGAHAIEIQVNGQVMARREFTLSEK